MANLSSSPVSVSDVQVESFAFASTAKAPGSTKAFFLAGAGSLKFSDAMCIIIIIIIISVWFRDDCECVTWTGTRELVVGEGKVLKATAIGVYLEEGAVPLLAGKWKGKTAEELMDSVEFFRDIVTGNARFVKTGDQLHSNLVSSKTD